MQYITNGKIYLETIDFANCDSNEIGDGYHYVMSCGALNEEINKSTTTLLYLQSKYSQTCPCGHLY